jgi:HD-GYP domain-containing protein (c-di-GMP phosphodiesterase class II)
MMVDTKLSFMPRTKENPVTTFSPAVLGEPAARGIEEFRGKLRTGRNLGGEQAEGVLLSLAKVVEQRDSHTAGHCERLAFTGVALGIAMGLDSASLMTIYLGGYLHDVGKVGIPDTILFKTGPLTDDEWTIMRSHTVRGEEICRPLQSFREVLPLVRSHHERMDGTGYPDKLAGDRIPLLARVIQTVDIYDALTNTRSYKGEYTRTRALEIMEEEAAKGWRDPDLTALFVRLNTRVLTRVSSYIGTNRDTSMQESLANLTSFLAQ